MARIAEDLFRRAALDDAGGVHDVHAVGIARDDAEVVRDDDDRDAEAPREILHQLEDLRLDGDVERRRRLVGNEQLGIAGKADRDHHALAHAAGKLVWVLLEPALGVGDADERQELDGAGLRLLGRHLQVNEERLHDLQPDPEDRVQRRHGLLEDHRHVMAADAAHLFVRELQEVAAIKDNSAGRDLGRLREEPHDRERGNFPEPDSPTIATISPG